MVRKRTKSTPQGLDWERINGSLTRISVGESGVWGVTSENEVLYRQGTSRYDGHDDVGSRWATVPGSFRYIASGNGIVWGISTEATEGGYKVYVRDGICFNSPTGKKWVQIAGHLSQISVDNNNNNVAGVNHNYLIWKQLGKMKQNYCYSHVYSMNLSQHYLRESYEYIFIMTF